MQNLKILGLVAQLYRITKNAKLLFEMLLIGTQT
jgi:hypothetical protein